jgi:hypothetical protein
MNFLRVVSKYDITLNLTAAVSNRDKRMNQQGIIILPKV